MQNKEDYQLIDSGEEKKYEKFGKYYLVRPCSQAIWKPKIPVWNTVDATFVREEKKQWSIPSFFPDSWHIHFHSLQLELRKTDFGHVGIFPEHGIFCNKLKRLVKPKMKILNLFSYTGLITLFCAKLHAQVCHVDASKATVLWAKKNADINELDKAPIRWIVDDVIKFVKREIKRKSSYDAIILDPPTFGRGSQGQVFKIEKDLSTLLELMQKLLGPRRKFVILSCHTPMISPVGLKQIFEQYFPNASENKELVLKATKGYNIPSGSYALWEK